MAASYRHVHAAHCESGVAVSLLRNGGCEISEPMVFGIGSGIFFLHVPFYKIMGFPVTTFRTYPGSVFSKACRRLGVSYRAKTYRSRARGIRALDSLLDQGIPTGLQACMFWLPYFPVQFRFQFNAHNLIALGRVGTDYELSDPVLEGIVVCPGDALTRARFAKGPLAPRGRLFHLVSVPTNPDYEAAITEAVGDSCRQMLGSRVPFFGVRGIRYLARHVARWPEKMKDGRRAKLYLGNVVRMQEEIGTGGAGFRFMYAAFLQEAGERLGSDELIVASEGMTGAGDLWREFAAKSAHLCKDRDGGSTSFSDLAAMLLAVADREEQVFDALGAWLGKRGSRR